MMIRTRSLVLAPGLVLFALSPTMMLPPASSAALVLPNPCTIAPASLVAGALGVQLSAVHGVVKSQKSDGFTVKTCTFTSGAVYASITIAPKAYGSGGSGGPPGMVHTTPTGLGSSGSLYYDTSSTLYFANASFIKGKYWASAYSKAHVPEAKVLALGRYVYGHLK